MSVIDTTDKTVEEIYIEKMQAMTSCEKHIKAAKMYLNVKAMVERHVLEESPGLSDMDLKRAVARRFYMHDPQTLSLIDMSEE